MAHNQDTTPGFSLGRILATPGALEALEASGQSPAEFLARHARQDWGRVSPGDQQLNDQALRTGERLLSAYETANGVRLWVLTEAADERGNRLCTTVLLPEEY
jgi:hypothetical protein